MATFQALPGFRDFYPDEMALRTHIVRSWREVARRYGFQEYDGPPLEPVELYTEKSGPEIVQQLYHFQDKGGREVAMRPEMTRSRISASPVSSPMGAARVRHILMPLYCAGLWLAVNIAPAMPRLPEAK